MLSGENIVCFAPDPWNDIWRNRHQIMSRFAAQNRVLYVEPRPYLRTVVRRMRRGELAWSELRAPLLTQVGANLWVFHPSLWTPISGRMPLSAITSAVRHALVRRVLRRLHMDAPILWLFRPDMVDLPGHYGERLVVYHIVDEYSGYSDLDATQAASIQRRERDLMARADLVLVTSRALLESKRGNHPNVHWVPNGVDYEQFSAAVCQRAEPIEMIDLPHPRIGYVGAINDKIDVPLLLRVAETYPEAAIVLVGPVRMALPESQREIEALRACPNVRFVGQVGVERVPHFVAACDVGLLPYRYNAWTQHIQPLKMYEYLSCGLPVVSTDIPAVHDEGDLIRVAADSQGFVAAIAEVLAQGPQTCAIDQQSARQERMARAARNTWGQRVERISELVQHTLSDLNGGV